MKSQILSAIALAAIAGNAVSDEGPYWRDSYGNLVRSGFGECVRTINWTPEAAIEECDENAGKKLVIKKPAPAAPVEARKPDSDRDGVLDAADACPDSPSDKPVDAQGCTLVSVVLKDVRFESNSSELTPSSYAALDKAVDAMNQYDHMTIEIQAHTDSMGDASYNQSLSEQRANAVRDYMIEQGIAADRMTAKGYGESRPVADNGTREGRAQNRRVELKINE